MAELILPIGAQRYNSLTGCGAKTIVEADVFNDGPISIVVVPFEHSVELPDTQHVAIIDGELIPPLRSGNLTLVCVHD